MVSLKAQNLKLSGKSLHIVTVKSNVYVYMLYAYVNNI